MLVIRRKSNERLLIEAGGRKIWVRLGVAAMGKAAIMIDAPPDVVVTREEMVGGELHRRKLAAAQGEP